jgi:hypothetical protein
MLNFQSILSDRSKLHDLIKFMIGTNGNNLSIWFAFSRPFAFRINKGAFMFNSGRFCTLGKECEHHKKIILCTEISPKQELLKTKDFYYQYDKALARCFLENATKIATEQLFPKKENKDDDATQNWK